MSDCSLDSPTPIRKRDSPEDLFDKLKRECSSKRKRFVLDDSLPPSKMVDLTKLWTSSAHIDIFPLRNASPEEPYSRVSRSYGSDDDDSSSDSRSTVFSERPFVIKDRIVDKLKCDIHSETSEPVGLFEEIPDVHCSNPICRFYVSPSVIQEKSRPKRRSYRQKSSKSPASPAKRQKIFCPLPIISGDSKRDNLERDNVKKNALQSTSPDKETSPVVKINEKSTAKTACNSEDEANEEPESPPTQKTPTTIELKKRYHQNRRNESRTITFGACGNRTQGTTRRRGRENVRVDIPLEPREQHVYADESPTDDIFEIPKLMAAFDTTPPSDSELPVDSSSNPYDIGLGNKGNTCYVNATFQSLFALKDFVNDLSRLSREKEDAHPCLKLFSNLVLARKDGRTRRVDLLLTAFVRRLGMVHATFSQKGQQQDASEFLDSFLEIVRHEFPVGRSNPAEDQFLCRLYETLRCVKCRGKSALTQNYSSLCLSIDEKYETLDDCLQAFFAEDEREGTCEKCGTSRKMVSHSFDTLPKTLILVIKRYLANNVKVNKEITAPNVLDLDKYTRPSACIDSTKLKLVAKITHLGETINDGHYIAHALCDDAYWRLYDDRNVRKVAAAWNAEHREAAYIYFYQLMPA